MDLDPKKGTSRSMLLFVTLSPLINKILTVKGLILVLNLLNSQSDVLNFSDVTILSIINYRSFLKMVDEFPGLMYKMHKI